MLRRFLALTCLLVPGFARAEVPPKKFEVETHVDLAYRADKDADPVKHKLDLYIPKGEKNFRASNWCSCSRGTVPRSVFRPTSDS